MKLTYLLNGEKKVTDKSNDDVFILETSNKELKTAKVKALKDITLVKAEQIAPSFINYNDLYFLNGYQSWTDSKEYKLVKRLRNVRKSPHIITYLYGLDKYGDVNFYQYSIRKSHGYDVFYSKGRNELFIYNLNYELAYLIIELVKDSRDIHLISDVKGLKLKANEEQEVFKYKLYKNYEEGLEAFRNDFKKKDILKIFGYSSWYNYYQNINEEIILRDLDGLDSRFNMFQIDDGYEAFVGDWLDVDKNKFPNGLEEIVKKIHSRGYKAGIWMAPFIAEEKSELFKNHNDWIRRDKNRRLIKAGGNWSGFYSLDIENEEVKDYIRKCLKHYMDLGFDFFKLDFLYASVIDDFEGKTRCQAQNEAYKLLRDTLKDKLILGCGANIINSYNNFDYLRIGPDVSLTFDDVFYMKLLHRERISTKITLQNTIFRSIFNGHLFGNDPDVFLLRDDNIGLSKEQRHALAKINALFGSVLMTSDDMNKYDEEKRQELANALDLFKNAKVTNYYLKGKLITVDYEAHGENHQFIYDINKGILIYDR